MSSTYSYCLTNCKQSKVYLQIGGKFRIRTTANYTSHANELLNKENMHYFVLSTAANRRQEALGVAEEGAAGCWSSARGFLFESLNEDLPLTESLPE